jgi:hypothetical protein
MGKDFDPSDDDYIAIQIAMNIARLLLRKSNLTPLQVVGLGKALYALEKFPTAIPGADVEFGIVYRAGDEDFGEMRYVTFHISDTEFEISSGGSVYDRSVGSDSFSRPGWVIEVGSYRETGCDLDTLEDEIREYLNLGATPTVECEGDFEMIDSDDEDCE